jgi:hypothetical protein
MTVTEPRTDTKAGYSSWCRRGEHRTCETVKARCACPHHGTHGQQPPTPTTPAPKEQPMTVTAEVTQLRPPPDDHPKPTPGDHVCPDCPRTFAAAQGLGAHRARAHGYRSPQRDKPAAPKRQQQRTPKPQPDVQASAADDRCVILVGLDANASTLVLPTETYARQVAALLVELGHEPHVFRLADGR